MPPLYKKLQGAYNINLEQSNISRYVDFRPLESNVFFNNTHIELPIILTTKDNVKGTYDDIKRLENNAKGKWRIIHNNPDSIFIEVPKSILNGKYAVIFKKATHLYQTSYHSNKPEESLSGNLISNLRAEVFTGSKLTVHSVPLRIG